MSSSNRKTTILVIDDDLDTLIVLKQAIEMYGYRVISARRAIEALDFAREHQPDLIFTDINLPDMSGFELATTLRGEEPFQSTPIIAGSVETDSIRDMIIAAGINGFLAKPYNVESLGLELQFYLSGGMDTIEEEDRIDRARSELMRNVVKRLEDRIRTLEEQNAELERIDTMKDSFIQLTAHELRTPLTLISGYTRLIEDHPDLLDRLKDSDDLRMLIAGLGDSVTRMHRIVEEILTISRIMTQQIDFNPRTVFPIKLLERVLKPYHPVLDERNLTLTYRPDQWPYTFIADEDLLSILLDSLLSNAIKYTPDGGAIRIYARYNDRLLQFSVQDTGIGIDPADQKLIFERMSNQGDISMHTTSKTAFMGGGLGIGLAIAKGIVEAHEGTISVRSDGKDPNNPPGSEFRVTLPLKPSVTPIDSNALRRLKPSHDNGH